MNISTLLGVITCFSVVALAATGGGLSPKVLWNPMSLAIVLGGTIGASLVSFNLGDLLRLSRVIGVVFMRDKDQTEEDARDIVRVTRGWVKGDLRELSALINQIQSPFMRIGMKLVIDGMLPLEGVVETLRWRIERMKSKERAEVRILQAMSSFAPAFGMMGTLFGLIVMLRNTSADNLDAITTGMAVALMTTLYGIMLANIVFRPLASKLERRTEARVKRMQLIMESVCLMAQTRSASVMEEMTAAIITDFKDELGKEPPKGEGPESW